MRKKNRLNNQKKRKRRPFWMFAGSVILIFYFFCTVLHISDSSDKEQLVSPVVSDSTVSYKADTGTSYVSSAGLDKSNTFPEDAWNLILVNPWNSLPENYSVSLTYLENDQAVDSRCYPDLQDMIDACRAEGLSPVICSSYRTWEYQETLYEDEVNQLISQGYSTEDAYAKAQPPLPFPEPVNISSDLPGISWTQIISF